MSNEQEKTINKNTYKNVLGDILVTYTADWCGPCNRLKPDLLEYIKELKFQHQSLNTITKSEYKSNPDYKYIPAITLNGKYLQSSNISEVKKFVDSELSF